MATVELAAERREHAERMRVSHARRQSDARAAEQRDNIHFDRRRAARGSRTADTRGADQDTERRRAARG